MCGEKDFWHYADNYASGITPACAGKRFRFCRKFENCRDHPRMCGEKMPLYSVPGLYKGSPPHVRGKERVQARWCCPTGITPACAGKRCRKRFSPAPTRDHPRMCGEKCCASLAAGAVVGSPPHVRGKDSSRAFAPTLNGITPACAGKRLKRSRSTVPHAAIVPLFPSVCNKPAGSDGSPAGHDAPPFLPIENAVPASPAYNLRSL